MTRPTNLAGRALLVVVVALAVVAAGCSGSGSEASEPAKPTTPSRATTETTTTTTSAPGPEAYTGDDFYAVPEPLPAGDHGSLIRYQVVTPSVLPGATTYRVMYRSESLEGDPIAVTGSVIVPDGAAPSGGRPVLTVAHGTSGIADECAPSKSPGGELLLMADQVDQGWLIAATDYEGLGTPGRHPYLVGPSEGRGVIDAALAAAELPDADAGDQLAIAGYSQGGHGALWAAQVAPGWAPDLDVVGTFAGAPATEMDLILAAAPDGFRMMVIAGFAAAYPEADPSVYLTPEGVELLDGVDQGCTQEFFRSLDAIPTAELVRADRPGTGPWETLPSANDPGNVQVDSPILVVHSDEDDLVPVALSGLLQGRMCQVDQVVERRVLVGGGSHGGAAPTAYAQGLAWLAERLAGAGDATSTCPTS